MIREMILVALVIGATTAAVVSCVPDAHPSLVFCSPEVC